MKQDEKVVLDSSNVYFYNGSIKTTSFFYHMLCTGHYSSTGSFHVERHNFDSYLLIHMKSGSGYCVIDEKRYNLQAGDLALLNVYEHPSFGHAENSECDWVHFDGLEMKTLYKNVNSFIIKPNDQDFVDKAFNSFIEPFKEGFQPEEAIVNKYLTSLLTLFFSQDDYGYRNHENSRFSKVFNYINKNLNKDISIETLAGIASLSNFYFIRAFKEETGLTPHDYIIKSRVRVAAFYLSTTKKPLAEISYLCGFSNESAFCNTFKRLMKLTPNTFRKA